MDEGQPTATECVQDPGQQLAKITDTDVLLLSTMVTVVDSVHELDVIIDSQLCMDYGCACCRSLP